MGCGKTTLGHAVAQSASLKFIDLDQYIEHEQGMTVRQIFELHGEQYFRHLERETLKSVAGMHDVIVATGGGTPCQPGLMEIMNEHGLTVLLDASPDVLYRRLLAARDTRPLIAALDDDQLRLFINKALCERMPHYSKAQANFCSDRLESADQIADSVKNFIHRYVKPTGS